MCDYFNSYMGNTWNRDKVMAIAQFLPLALAGPAADVCPCLGKSLSSLSQMADSYRAITRLSLLFNALSKPTLNTLAKPHADAFLGRTEQLSHFFHVFYCIFENTAVLASHGVYPNRFGRLGGCAVVCWFYTLLIGLVRQTYILTQKKQTEEEKKAGLVTLLKIGCFFIFSMTCIPKGGPQLLADATGPLAPIHKLLQLIAPKHIALNNSCRGALGLIASVCDFY